MVLINAILTMLEAHIGVIDNVRITVAIKPLRYNSSISNGSSLQVRFDYAYVHQVYHYTNKTQLYSAIILF